MERLGLLQAVFERERSPFEVVSPGQVLSWIGGALLRGQRGFLGPFLRAGKPPRGRVVKQSRGSEVGPIKHSTV